LLTLDRAKDDFLSTVTHELRTPLASIRALSEILLQSPDINAAQRDRFLQIVVDEAKRLTRLINQVLDLARVQAGRMSLRPTDVDVDGVIREAIDSMAHTADGGRIVFASESRWQPTRIRTDRDALMQVVVNLLSNAVKFCEPGKCEVDVSVSLAEQSLSIAIKDNGPGIRLEDQERIFDRFIQLADPVAGRPDGSGLGLAISRKIVEELGGRLWVESIPGEGSTFIFTIPRLGPAGAPDDAGSGTSSSRSAR
jgi:signal transduction histidine kinase